MMQCSDAVTKDVIVIVDCNLFSLLIDGNRVGIEIPKVEVRFQNLSIEGDAYVGTRALPTLLNSSMNMIEVLKKLSFWS